MADRKTASSAWARVAALAAAGAAALPVASEMRVARRPSP
jgi:hypothetical protein